MLRKYASILCYGGPQNFVSNELLNANSIVLDTARRVTNAMHAADFPKMTVGFPLTGSLIPKIDKDRDSGMAVRARSERNERAQLKLESSLDFWRWGSPALTIKLKKDVSCDEIELLLDNVNAWSLRLFTTARKIR